jgi:hypothetical protein
MAAAWGMSVVRQVGGGGSGGIAGSVVVVPYRNRWAWWPMPPKGSTVKKGPEEHDVICQHCAVVCGVMDSLCVG